jgi:hypothetical protein
MLVVVRTTRAARPVLGPLPLQPLDRDNLDIIESVRNKAALLRINSAAIRPASGQ